MTQVVADEGVLAMWSSILAGHLDLRLFANDVRPNRGSTRADFVEPKLAGYAPILLLSTEWELTPESAAYPEQEFTFVGVGEDIYGYFVLKGPTLYWAERFSDGPYSTRRVGDRVFVTVRQEWRR